jgi:hypothetical protein
MSHTMSSETGIPHKEWCLGSGGGDRVRVKANPYSRSHGSYLVKSVAVRGRSRETKQVRRSGELKGDVMIEIRKVVGIGIEGNGQY